MADPLPNRAGLIVFNRAGQVLVCSSLIRSNIWVFPKGHIEPNEASYEAAERECVEETGVYAVVDSSVPLLSQTYTYQNEDVIVEWWTGLAVKLQHEKWKDTGRVVRWVPPTQALELLSFAALRNALRAALCLDEEETITGAVILTDAREEVSTK